MNPTGVGTVFFTCSTTSLNKNKDNYANTIDLLDGHGLKVVSNIGINVFADNNIEDDFSQYSNSTTYFSTMKKVSQADFLVVDCTVASMTIGHIVTYALANKKPVLLISKFKSEDSQDLFIAGSEEPLLTFKIYSEEMPIENIIRAYMRKVRKESRIRLNFVVEKDLSDKLDWLSFRTKMSKTDIIRQAINKFDPHL